MPIHAKGLFYELQFASFITHALIWWVERDCTRRALLTHRCAVLHHGVVQFMTLRCATREETTLANVIVEVFQTAISAKRERKLTISMLSEKQHELFCFTQENIDRITPKQPFCSFVKLLSTCYWMCLKLTVLLRILIHSSHVALNSITSLPHSLEVFLFHRFSSYKCKSSVEVDCTLCVVCFFWSL